MTAGVEEVYGREDVVQSFARVCRIIRTSARFPYFGTRVPNKLFVFDTHAHNHHYSQPEMVSKDRPRKRSLPQRNR